MRGRYLRRPGKLDRAAPESGEAGAYGTGRFGARLITITYQARRWSCYLGLKLASLVEKEFADGSELLHLLDRVVSQQRAIDASERVLSHEAPNLSSNIPVSSCNHRTSERPKSMKRVERVPTRVEKQVRD